jgi:hypothetical protein
MNLLPVFQIQLNRIRVALVLLRAKYTVENTDHSIRWFGKGISNARERAMLYMEQNMFLVRLYKTTND